MDAILGAASGNHTPAPLIDQLAPGGRLVMPVGGERSHSVEQISNQTTITNHRKKQP